MIAPNPEYPASLEKLLEANSGVIRWEKNYRTFVTDGLKSPSPTLGIKPAIERMKKLDPERGNAALNLGVGQLAVERTPSDDLKNALMERMRQDAKEHPTEKRFQIVEGQAENLYAPPAGTDGVRAAFAYDFARKTGCDVDMDNAAAASGGKGVLAGVLDRLNPDDTIILWAPGWPTNYENLPPGVKVVIADASPRGAPTPEQAEAVLKAFPEARAMLIGLGNPGAEGYSKEEREEVAGVIRRHVKEHLPHLPPGTHKSPLNFMLVWDEPYNTLTLDGEPDLAFGEDEKALFEDGYSSYVWSASKVYGMPGLRVGAVIANDAPIDAIREKWVKAELETAGISSEDEAGPELAGRLRILRNYARGSVGQVDVFNQTVSNQSSIESQNLAQAFVLYGEQKYTRDIRDYLREQRDLLIKGLEGIPALSMREPKLAMYAWLEFLGLRDAEKWIPKGTFFVHGEGDKEGLANAQGPVRLTSKNFFRFMEEGFGIYGMHGNEAYGPESESFQLRAGISVAPALLEKAAFRLQKGLPMLANSREEAAANDPILPQSFARAEKANGIGQAATPNIPSRP